MTEERTDNVQARLEALKPKQNVKGGTDLEDFDFDDYDEDEGDGLSDEEQEDEEA